MKHSVNKFYVYAIALTILGAAACSSSPKKETTAPEPQTAAAQQQQQQHVDTPANADLGAGSSGRGL